MQTPNWAKQIADSFGSAGTPPDTLPKYRVIWAPDRLELCYGRTVRAYPHIGERWILEVLIPWERFGPWREDAFGPKPRHGEYCHSHTIQFSEDGGKTSKFMSLDDFGADTLRLLITCVERGKMIQGWQMRNHRDQMLEAEEKENHRIFSDLWDDSTGIGLVGGPLGENAVSGIPSKKTSADQAIVTLDQLSPEEQKKYRCRPGSVRQIS